MEFFLHPSTLTLVVHAIIVIAIVVRVITKRPATGVALAWLLLVSAVPFAGAVFYLLIGERRISRQRSSRIARLRTDFAKIAEIAIRDGITDVDWSTHHPAARGMSRLGQNLGGAPTVRGSEFQMFSDTQESWLGWSRTSMQQTPVC